MKNAAPFVSVIIPVRNAEKTIQACLMSLLRTSYPADSREIILVDNGSTDRSLQIVEQYPVVLLRESRRGPAAARNTGIVASQGEILALIDADCLASKNWLETLVQGLEDKQVSAIQGQTIGYPPVTAVEQFAAMTGSHSYSRSMEGGFAPYLNTCNVAIRREVFTQVGLFDTRFPAGEDVDFGWRFFSKEQLKAVYQPKAVVFHRHRNTTSSFFAQHVWYGCGIAALRVKYPARLPWGVHQELRAWGTVVEFAWLAAQTAVRHRLRGHQTPNVNYPYFRFVRKLGVRVGFAWQSLIMDHQWDDRFQS